MWGNQAAHASVAGVLPGPRFWGGALLTLANCLSTTVSITLSTIPVEAPDCHSGVGWPSVGQVAISPHESATAPHFWHSPVWLGRLGLGHGLAVAYLAQVLGAEGDFEPRVAAALGRVLEGPS